MTDQLPILAPPRALTVPQSAVTVPATPSVDHIRGAIAVLRRRWFVFALVFLAVLGGVAAYTLNKTPQFTATATLQVNARQINTAPSKETDVLPQTSDEDRAVSAEAQVLQSDEVAGRVVRAVGAKRPGFAAALTGLPPRYASTAILDAVEGRLRVDRPGGTNILSLAFTAPDPAIAADVANEYARQYLASKVDVRLGAARTADEGLRRELDRMRGEVEQAEGAVAEYRRAHNLLSANGTTLTEGEQSLFKQQQATAQTQLAEEEAGLATAKAQLRHGSQGGDVGAALGSPVIGQLRAQRAQASAKLAQLESRYQSDHPSVIDARREVADIDTAIRGEIGRVISNLEARVSVARQRAAAASGIASQSRGELAVNAQASVKLNELERRAEALRTNYAGMLQRQTAVASQAVVADVDARLLSPARVPSRPSFPNKKISFVLGLLLALLLGAAAVAVMQLLDRRMVASREVEQRLGLPHLVNVPTLASITKPSERKTTPVDFVIDRPFSVMAESMRSLLLVIEKGTSHRAGRYVGITSAQPGEGKSTIAACLARVAAVGGRRTLLIDGDVRRPRVAAIFGSQPKLGLLDVLAGTVPLKDALIKDERSGLWLLPALTQSFDHSRINSEAAFRELMRQIENVFDLVVIDVAPALAAVESRLLMNYVDQVIMVVRWRHTPASVVRAALKRLQSIGVQPAGVVMSQVNMRAIAAYAVEDVDHAYRKWGSYYE